MRKKFFMGSGFNLFKLVVSSICLIALFVPMTVRAASHSRDEAVSWAVSQIGKGLDYDNVYGNQCVDLIKYYYDYFGYANYAMGNANAYATNNLPPGWQRIYGDYQPGDIAVWKVNHSCSTCGTSSLGHVGIITSADSVGFNAINQNFNNTPSCTQNWFYVSALQCAIRPMFSGGSQPSGNLSYSSVFAEWTDTWNALLKGTISNPSRMTVSSVGVQIWDSAGNMVVDHSENCGLSTSTVNQELNIVGEALSIGLRQGETYTFRMWANANGNVYQSELGNFTIKDDQPPVITNAYVEDVTEMGYTVYCTVTDNFQVDRVQFPTWTLYNGQDDLESEWYVNSKVSGSLIGSNLYKFRVNIEDHNYEEGVYRTHIYAYDKYGNSEAFRLQDVEISSDNVPPEVLNTEITYPNEETAHVKITASDNDQLGKLEGSLLENLDNKKIIMPVDGVYEFEWILNGNPKVAIFVGELFDKAGNKTSFQMFLGKPKDELVLMLGGLPYDINTIKENFLEDEKESLSDIHYQDNYLKVEDNKIIPLGTGVSKCIFTEAGVVKIAMYIYVVDETTVSMNKKELMLSEKRRSEQLFAHVTPVNVINKNITWDSSNSNVATVDQSGHVTAVGNGVAIITAVSDEDGQTASCEVTVDISGTSTSEENENFESSTEQSCIVIFQANGGKNLSDRYMVVKKNQILWNVPTIQRKNYIFKGWYTEKTGGSRLSVNTRIKGDQTFYAQWTKLTKPQKSSISSLKKQGKRGFVVTYKKVAEADGYEISYSNNKKFKSSKRKIYTSSLSKTVKGLKKGGAYYVRVRAYKVDSAGSKVYGKYSKVKRIKL